jgi:hypothetical protein
MTYRRAGLEPSPHLNRLHVFRLAGCKAIGCRAVRSVDRPSTSQRRAPSLTPADRPAEHANPAGSFASAEMTEASNVGHFSTAARAAARRVLRRPLIGAGA